MKKMSMAQFKKERRWNAVHQYDDAHGLSIIACRGRLMFRITTYTPKGKPRMAIAYTDVSSMKEFLDGYNKRK